MTREQLASSIKDAAASLDVALFSLSKGSDADATKFAWLARKTLGAIRWPPKPRRIRSPRKGDAE